MPIIIRILPAFCSISVFPFACLLYMTIIISCLPFVASVYLLTIINSFVAPMYLLLRAFSTYVYYFPAFCTIKVSPFACLLRCYLLLRQQSLLASVVVKSSSLLSPNHSSLRPHKIDFKLSSNFYVLTLTVQMRFCCYLCCHLSLSP